MTARFMHDWQSLHGSCERQPMFTGSPHKCESNSLIPAIVDGSKLATSVSKKSIRLTGLCHDSYESLVTILTIPQNETDLPIATFVQQWRQPKSLAPKAR